MSYRFKQTIQLCLISLIVAGLLLVPATPTVQATPGYAYKWLLRFDFASSFDGQLEIEVGVNDNGLVVQPPLYSQTVPVRCQRVGAVGLSGGVAKFNGGYLQCDMQLQRVLEETFAACAQIDPSCALPINAIEQYRSFKIAANFLAPTQGLAPIFSHESASYALDIATVTHAVQTDLDPIGIVASAAWPVAPTHNTMYQHSARFGCSMAGDCGIHFNVAGNAQYVNSADAPVDFLTTPTTFYIGRDQAGTTLIPGSVLDSFIVDPGNGFGE